MAGAGAAAAALLALPLCALWPARAGVCAVLGRAPWAGAGGEAGEGGDGQAGVCAEKRGWLFPGWAAL